MKILLLMISFKSNLHDVASDLADFHRICLYSNFNILDVIWRNRVMCGLFL